MLEAHERANQNLDTTIPSATTATATATAMQPVADSGMTVPSANHQISTMEPWEEEALMRLEEQEYEQQNATTTTTPNINPTSMSLDTLFLDHLNLPKPLLDSYKRKGVKDPYPWQAECLQQSGVLDQGRNLLYCAPTSGGKSMVAEVRKKP